MKPRAPRQPRQKGKAAVYTTHYPAVRARGHRILILTPPSWGKGVSVESPSSFAHPEQHLGPDLGCTLELPGETPSQAAGA